MIHMSEALGVNCTFCHNTRAIASWPQSTPQRVTAWNGIRMVRNINNVYLDPLQPCVPGEPARAPWRRGEGVSAPPATRA